MRRAAKVDGNHADIVGALRAAGASVQSLAAVGDGCPDLLVGIHSKTMLMELKDPKQPPNKRKLRANQTEWHKDWRGGPLATVDSIDAALRMIGAMK